MRKGPQRGGWTKPLQTPAIALILVTLVLSLLVMWK